MKSILLLMIILLLIPLSSAQNVIEISDICQTSSIAGVDLTYRYCLPLVNYQSGNSEVEIMTIEIFNEKEQSDFPSTLNDEAVDFIYIDYFIVVTKTDDNADYYTFIGNRTVTEKDYDGTFHETIHLNWIHDVYEKSFRIEHEYSITHSLRMGYTLENGTGRYITDYPSFVDYNNGWEVVSIPKTLFLDPLLVITWTNWRYIYESFQIFSAVGLVIAVIIGLNFRRLLQALENRKKTNVKDQNHEDS